MHVKYHNVLGVDTLHCVFVSEGESRFFRVNLEISEGIFGGVLFCRFFHMETLKPVTKSPGGFLPFFPDDLWPQPLRRVRCAVLGVAIHPLAKV